MDLDTWPPRTNNLDPTMGYILLTFYWPLGQREWGLRLQRMMDRVVHGDCWDYYFPVHDYEPYGARFMSSDKSKFNEELANVKHIEKTEVIPFTDLRVIDFSNVTSARDVDEDGSELLTPTADEPTQNEDNDKKPAAAEGDSEMSANVNQDSGKDGSGVIVASADGRAEEEDPVARVVNDSDGQEHKQSRVVGNYDGGVARSSEVVACGNSDEDDRMSSGKDASMPPANTQQQLTLKGGGIVDLTSPTVDSDDGDYKFTTDIDFQWHCRSRLRGVMFIMTLLGADAYGLFPKFYLTKYDKEKPLMYSKGDYKMLVEHFMIKAGLKGGCVEDIIKNNHGLLGDKNNQGWTDDDFQAVSMNLRKLEKKFGCWDNMSNKARTKIYNRHLGVLRSPVTHDEEKRWLALYEHDKYQAKLCKDGSEPHPDVPEGGLVGTMDALWSATFRHQLESSKKYWLYDTNEGKEWRKENERKYRAKIGMKTPSPPNIPFPCNPLTPGGQHEIKPWHPLQTPPRSGPQYTPKSCCSSATENFPGIYDKKTSVGSSEGGGDYESDEDNGSMGDFIVNSDQDDEEEESESNDSEAGVQTNVKRGGARHASKKRNIPAKVTKSTKTRKKKKIESPDISSDDGESEDEEDEQPFRKKKGLAGLKNILFEDSE